MSSATDDADGFGNGQREHPWQWHQQEWLPTLIGLRGFKKQLLKGTASLIAALFLFILNKGKLTVLGDILSTEKKRSLNDKL